MRAAEIAHSSQLKVVIGSAFCKGVKYAFDSCYIFLAYHQVSFIKIDVKKLHYFQLIVTVHSSPFWVQGLNAFGVFTCLEYLSKRRPQVSFG